MLATLKQSNRRVCLEVFSETNRFILDSVLTFLGVEVRLLPVPEKHIGARPRSRRRAQESVVNYGLYFRAAILGQRLLLSQIR